MSTRSQKIAQLTNKEYRDAFVGSQINVGLPFQIRALREQRKWKQSELADKAGMLQPRISAMERPGGTKFNLETLRRIASALDVALVVRFAPFSELVDLSEAFNPEEFDVPGFKDDAGLIERKPNVSELYNSTTSSFRVFAEATTKAILTEKLTAVRALIVHGAPSSSVSVCSAAAPAQICAGAASGYPITDSSFEWRTANAR